jgi:Fe2+ or Zn2+ uptake regulation protein
VHISLQKKNSKKEDGVSYYELKSHSKKPLHFHFQCVKCNDIIGINEKKIAVEYLRLNKTAKNAGRQTNGETNKMHKG